MNSTLTAILVSTHPSSSFDPFTLSAPDTTAISETTGKARSVQDLLNWLYAGISLIGLLGNGIAIYVLTSSTTIRRSNCYTLLVNQSLVDIFTCLSTLFWLLTEKYVTRTQLTATTWNWFMCTYVHSQFPLATGVLISSYNLALLSLERMISIVFPVAHRIHGNAKNQRRVALLVWIAGVVLTVAYTTPTNGVTSNGGCFFWRRFPSQLKAKVFAVSFTFGYTFLPVTGMLVSYTMIYWRIAIGGGTTSGAGSGSGASKSVDKVKLNVVKMLATCVLAYLGCHILRATISIASRFGGRFSTSSPLYTVSLTLLQANSAVNPFVYMFQYREYKKELQSQIRKLLRLKETSSVMPSSSSNS